MDNGYLAAAKVDKLINSFLEKDPITKDNAREYNIFGRTVCSTGRLIELASRVTADLPMEFHTVYTNRNNGNDLRFSEVLIRLSVSFTINFIFSKFVSTNKFPDSKLMDHPEYLRALEQMKAVFTFYTSTPAQRAGFRDALPFMQGVEIDKGVPK